MTLTRHCGTARSTPQHRALGARMVPFGGWEMPIQYAGVLEEHRACRDARGRVRRVAPRHGRVRAARARSTLLQWLLTNDLEPHRARPGAVHAPARPRRRARRRRHHRVVGRRRALLRDAERVEHRRAARRVRRRRSRTRDGAVEFADVTATRAVLAVQGPQARALLADGRARRGRGAAVRGASAVGELRRRGHRLHRRGRRRDPRAGRPTRPALWDALVDAGIAPGRARRARHAAARSRAAAARPRARARASRRCRPGSAGSCAGTRATSAAAAPLEAERERGVARRLRGLAVDGPPAGARGRGRARATAPTIGVVTSGNFSPTLGHGIALAFLPPGARAGRRGRGRRARQTGAGHGRADRRSTGALMTVRDATPRRPRRDPRDGARARRVRA